MDKKYLNHGLQTQPDGWIRELVASLKSEGVALLKL